MNKKAMTLQEIMTAFIVIVAFILIISILYAPAGGWFTKIFGIDLSKYAKFGSEQIQPTQTDVPKNIQEAYDNLASAFQQKGSECLVKTPAIDADFKEYKINMQPAPDGTWLIIQKKQAEGKFVEVKSQKILSVKPCAIAGKKDNVIIAQEFYNQKILRKPGPTVSSFYNDQYQVLSLTGNERLNEFSIDDNDLTYGGQEIDLFYKPIESILCFFPTFDIGYTQAKESGLNDDLLKEMLPGGKYNQLDVAGKPTIPFCSGEEVLCNIYKRCQDITSLDICKSIGTKCELKCQVNAATQRYCETYNPLGIPQ